MNMFWIKLPSGRYVNLANLYFVGDPFADEDNDGVLTVRVFSPGDETPISVRGADAEALVARLDQISEHLQAKGA